MGILWAFYERFCIKCTSCALIHIVKHGSGALTGSGSLGGTATCLFTLMETSAYFFRLGDVLDCQQCVQALPVMLGPFLINLVSFGFSIKKYDFIVSRSVPAGVGSGGYREAFPR